MLQAIWKTKLGKLSKKIILLHDRPHPYTANLMKETLAAVGWEIRNHLPYKPDLAPSDFHLFEPMMVHLEGQKFQTDDELKHSVLNWLHSQDKTFYAAAISNWPGQ
jgi:hypothetical protein